MINLNKNDGPRAKCYFTSSVLPESFDQEQISDKKRPFSTILERKFNRTLSVILPVAQSDDFKANLDKNVGQLQYAKVYMKLSELIERDFFNQYIKSGNILMISAGRPGLDNVFSLCEGILRLVVDKATYERMGLNGTVISSGGRKHVKARHAIELNLRLPSMVHGKHGFERVVWAFKNVLDHSVTWLFYDLSGKNDGSGPIAQHQPKIVTVKPEIDTLNGARVPKLTQEIGDDGHDLATDLLEWLSLAIMGSPRVQQKDTIDSYLSRYRVPSEDEDIECTTQDLAVLRWHGLIPATFIKGVVLAALTASSAEWFGVNAVGFDGRAYSVLQRRHHTLTWEYEN